MAGASTTQRDMSRPIQDEATQASAERRFRDSHQIDDSGCWIWTGSRNAKGYGYFWLRGATVRASRAAWLLFRGPIPRGLHVCHHCDNPPCVNPDHLFLGDALDNVRDRDSKGRTARGERSGRYTHPERNARGDENGSRTHPERRPRGDRNYMHTQPEVSQGERNGRAKLTRAEVDQIRLIYSQGGISQKALGQRFGIGPTEVRDIVKFKRWAPLTDAERASIPF